MNTENARLNRTFDAFLTRQAQPHCLLFFYHKFYKPNRQLKYFAAYRFITALLNKLVTYIYE